MSKEYNTQETAEFLDVCPRTVAAYRQENKIPFVLKKIPTTVFVETAVFKESDLIKFKKSRDEKKLASKAIRPTQAEASL